MLPTRKGTSAESTTGSTATARPWSRLGRHTESEADASLIEPPRLAPWLSSQEPHEYEEVMAPPGLKEKGPLYHTWYPEEAPWIPEYQGPYQQRRKSLAGYEEIMPVYDPVADSLPFSRDRSLPLEHLGELV
uniref:Uncharacterized protein n=1 Tax=Sphaerodactylus townsendi TaxID=933632 RepID=A0ACB8FRT6_9SAUR